MGSRILTKVLVGSRLHGLATDKSDYDWRGIYISPLKDVLSPFKRVPNTSWIEGDEDNTSYELADFCEQATHGNATILEVFFSNQIKLTTPTADKMRANWQKFIDTDKFLMASRGYAQSQYNKMNLFEPDARTPKFACAYLRVLWQCAKFFETGEFHCQIDEPKMKDYMFSVKNNWSNELIPELTEQFIQMQGRVTRAYASAKKLTPDYDWIEDFIYEAYISND